ncbi:MAG: flagellar hook-length control protein FliK [Granulosicoccaceae bacterium]
MLNSGGQAILVAQSTTTGFDLEAGDISRSNQSVNIEFSTEFSRAQESINAQASDIDQTITTPTDLKLSSDYAIAPEYTDTTAAVPLADNRPLNSVRATELLTDLSAGTEIDSAVVGQTITPEYSIDGVLLDQEGATSIGLMQAKIAPAKLSANTAIGSSDAGNTLTPILNNAAHSDGPMPKQAEMAEAAMIVDEKLENMPSLDAPAATLSDKTDSRIAHKLPHKEIPKPIVVTGLEVATQTVDPAKAAVIEKDGSTPSASLPASGRLNTRELIGLNINAETFVSGGVENGGVPDNPAKPGADQAALHFKPSPALIKSGLGRIRVELSSSAKLATPKIDAVSLQQEVVNSPKTISKPVSPLVPSSASSSVLAATNTEKGVTVVGHEFLRSIGSAQVEPFNQKSNKANPTTVKVATTDDPKQGVNLQVFPKTVPTLGLTNTPPQNILAESAITISGTSEHRARDLGLEPIVTAPLAKHLGIKNTVGTLSHGGDAKNSGEQLMQSPGGMADKNAALAQALDATTAEHQNKFAEVTPGISLKKMGQLAAKADTSSLQALTGLSDVTPSNGYYVTAGGIITAASSPLNMGPSSGLVSAPRTLLLDQPDADQSLLENLRWAVNEKLSRATINVTPANLGPITVSVDVENQNMSVSIITNNAAAKEAIDHLLPRMREHFATEGYQQVSVDVSSQQDRQSNLRNQSEHSFEHEADAEADLTNSELDHAENNPANAHERASTSLIDTYV